jgi:ceramide glucosyltransferase
VDDDLAENLASFAALDHATYEVVLGVRSPRDPAFAVARAAVRRWPERFRLVVQRHEPGRNPKVNQLVGLVRAARFPLLVVSDSNVRVEPGYLADIAAELRDPSVGLVTHPVCGAGERRLGSILENLHLAGSVAPAMAVTHQLTRRPIVVGKSMALRRADLERLGGFEVVKDVLAEDHVLGTLVRRRLGKRVVVSRRPVVNVNRDRRVGDFWGRYARWSVLQRKLVGGPAYAAQLVLDPVLLALLGLLARPDATALAAFGLVCATKIAVDAACARALRPAGFPLWQLALIPAKDVLFGAALIQGFLTDEVEWRGNRLRVLRGTRLAPARESADPVAVARA